MGRTVDSLTEVERGQLLTAVGNRVEIIRVNRARAGTSCLPPVIAIETTPKGDEIVIYYNQFGGGGTVESDLDLTLPVAEGDAAERWDW